MSAPLLLDDQQLARLQLLLSRAAGLVFDDARRESLSYSLAERLRATGRTDVGGYLDDVSAPGSTERQELLDEVTIQETHFFRNPPQVRALRAHVLPELLRAAAGTRRLRVWSAGCSTGEEAYTIAMVLRELLPTTAGWDIEVVATDISERALSAARVGRYGARAVQLASPQELARHFVRLDDGRYEVRPEVRELVSFRHHNLVTETPPFPAGERLDLVLCRNVTIYFSRETTRELVRRLHGCLRDGGYLLLGHAETLWQLSAEFRLVSLGSGDTTAFLYRRLDATVTAGPAERRHVLPDRRTGDDGLPPGGERRTGPRRAWLTLTRSTGPVDARPGTPDEPPESRPVRTHLQVARAALAEGRYADAETAAALAVLAEPLRAEAHRLRAQALLDLGRDTEALVCLRKVVYLDADDAMAHFLLAGVLARLGAGDAAAREYHAAAAVLGRREPGAAAPELGGRSVAELVQLCRELGRRLSTAGDVA